MESLSNLGAGVLWSVAGRILHVLHGVADVVLLHEEARQTQLCFEVPRVDLERAFVRLPRFGWLLRLFVELSQLELHGTLVGAQGSRNVMIAQACLANLLEAVTSIEGDILGGSKVVLHDLFEEFRSGDELTTVEQGQGAPQWAAWHESKQLL